MSTLRFETDGSGPPVLMIQGVGVRGRGWRPQIDALREACHLAWYDNRGLGDNPGPVGTVADMARDALGVMDALGWKSAHVVGHSLGGVIAQQVAVLAPERVRSLALLCTFARGSAALSFHPASLWINARTMIGTQAMRRRAFFELVSAPGIAPTEENIALLESAFGRGLADLPPAAPQQVMALARADLRAELAGLDIPAVVASATHDRVAPVSQGPMLAEALKCRFVELDGGHAVPVQDAAAVNALLLAHLAT
ncbi:MAG: alpha/beta fold hydrolase [Alphaproteobacteria bacterium]|nr:alpha/beta fold hydrolase [Alphaproteobacteria bacterium]